MVMVMEDLVRKEAMTGGGREKEATDAMGGWEDEQEGKKQDIFLSP